MSLGSTLAQASSPRREKFTGAFDYNPPPIPPWPTDPEERAELVRLALECEDGWRTAGQRDTAYLRGERAAGAGA